jgi:hypothetical protein
MYPARKKAFAINAPESANLDIGPAEARKQVPAPLAILTLAVTLAMTLLLGVWLPVERQTLPTILYVHNVILA